MSTVKVLSIAVLFAVLGTGYTKDKLFECYTCLYDDNFPDTPLTDRQCIAKPFNGQDVGTQKGCARCYKAEVTENGKLVSAHRGCGDAAIYEFAEKVSRQGEDYTIEYCKSNLCNGAPSMTTSFALVTSCIAFLYTILLKH